MKTQIFLLFLLFAIGNVSASASETKPENRIESEGEAGSKVKLEPMSLSTTQKNPWSFYYPYVPVKEDYALELGTMWETNNLYWIGATVGFHIDKCWWIESPACQQYFDLIGGASGRDGLTIGLALVSLRWQYIHWPSIYSPSVRVFTGYMNIREDERRKGLLTYGVGYGLTTAVHERVDLKGELRMGGGDFFWSQFFVSINFKMDKWIDYFGKKLQSFGEGTLSTTGQVLESTAKSSGSVLRTTIKAPVKIIEALSKKNKKERPEEALKPDGPTE